MSPRLDVETAPSYLQRMGHRAMSHWVALTWSANGQTISLSESQAVAVWALHFAPRVALLEEAVVLEVAQSIRLFGGKERLHKAVEAGALEMGVTALAWAPTALAGLALLRSGVKNGFAEPLEKLLDRLPLSSLTAVVKHEATLARLGCRTLAEVRRLPRGGISRRFEKSMLQALDQAYGLSPEVFEWEKIPETFAARLELPGRVDTAPGLLFGARRLLFQMGGWLCARHLGVTAFTLRWRHDVMRSRDVGDGGEIIVRTAQPTQNIEHLSRLLSEHLNQAKLDAAAGELELLVSETQPIIEQSGSLVPEVGEREKSLDLALERIEVRLGKKRVLQPVLQEDHRLEWRQRWQTSDTTRPKRKSRMVAGAQPTWVLRKPLKLAVVRDQPIYQGPLQLLLGPDRVEAGWWHRVEGESGRKHMNVQRDYWVAMSEHAGVLWIYQQRLANDETAWYLHGHFA
jgi:protein ImuB